MQELSYGATTLNKQESTLDYELIKQLSQGRALYYDFFAGFFLYEIIEQRVNLALTQMQIFSSQPLREQDLQIFNNLKKALQSHSADKLKDEYAFIFNIPFSAESKPIFKKGKDKHRKHTGQNPQIFLYLSHYLEGCLNGKSLLKAKKIIKQTHFRLADGFKESEEHFGFLLLLMRHLLQENDLKIAKEVFNECIKPMGFEIAKALKNRENLVFFAYIGDLLEGFLEIESCV